MYFVFSFILFLISWQDAFAENCFCSPKLTLMNECYDDIRGGRQRSCCEERCSASLRAVADVAAKKAPATATAPSSTQTDARSPALPSAPVDVARPDPQGLNTAQNVAEQGKNQSTISADQASVRADNQKRVASFERGWAQDIGLNFLAIKKQLTGDSSQKTMTESFRGDTAYSRVYEFSKILKNKDLLDNADHFKKNLENDAKKNTEEADKLLAEANRARAAAQQLATFENSLGSSSANMKSLNPSMSILKGNVDPSEKGVDAQKGAISSERSCPNCLTGSASSLSVKNNIEVDLGSASSGKSSLLEKGNAATAKALEDQKGTMKSVVDSVLDEKERNDGKGSDPYGDLGPPMNREIASANATDPQQRDASGLVEALDGNTNSGSIDDSRQAMLSKRAARFFGSLEISIFVRVRKKIRSKEIELRYNH